MRRVGIVLLLTLASAACVLLGLWQFDRHTHRSAAVDLVTTNLDAEVVPIETMLGPDLDRPLAPEDVWRPVTVHGQWIQGSGVALRNRPVEGSNASHALALLRTDSGAVLVVDRGWWAQQESIPAGVLDTPPGEVDLVLRLRAAEPLDARTNPPGTVYSTTPEAVLASSALDPSDLDGALITTGYGAQLSPAPTSPLAALPNPSTSLGSHLSYALQWWFFALAVPVAGIVLARRDARDRAEDVAHNAAESAADDQSQPPPRADRIRGHRRRASLEEEEDALLDAAAAQPVGPRAAGQASDTSSA